ncbi:hypothetical protein CK203_066474 [Vitis vinifera]|uniref:BED-type domain-containing protein n=1 Tax=Vitis vinifera TaxID=29760 RepID=A0A438FXN6_VITVI|nr:hypothetical protein CK203_066474 [Vitis vinifera]
MASEGGSVVPGRDPAWKYCLPIEGNRNGTICNFCGLVMKSGGITRFKSHLMHKDPHNNTKKCPRVPPEVKEEIRLLVHDKQKSKAKKNVDIEEIRSQLRGTMGTHHTHLVNEDDDNEDAEDEDVYMYPTDMHPDERDAYRSAVRASKASNWEREQHENIVGSKRKSGESSAGIPSTMRKSQSMRHSHDSPPIAPSLYKSSAAKQKNIKDIFKGGAIKETMGRLISKFFIYESVAPAKAKSHYFKNMIIGAQQAGMGIEPPSPYEIKNKYLEMEYKEMEAYVNQQREKWKTYGCTIMSDGWTGPTKLSIINFMVYSKGTTVFLKSVDASNYIKDHKYIYELLKTIIKEVGKENVVQIVTDNGSAFMKAGKQLMKKYNLYWTPCAAHCIDLIFEDIGKRPNVIEVINNARKITNFIYNHGWLLAQMRKYCGGDIVRPGATSCSHMPFVYELMHVMKENLIRQGAGDWMFKIIQDRWQKTLKHPLHAAAYFLNPRFQYRRGVGSDPELLQAVHDVFAKLDPTTESLGQFGNELLLFRDAKRGFGDRAAIASRSTMVPAEWWFMYGNQTPTLRKLAIKVLSQTASSSASEVGEEEDNQLFQWVRPIHLDDEVGNPDPRIAAHALEFGVNVERVLSEEVHSESFSKDTDDSLHATYSQQEIDSTSAGHSSRPSAAGTSASGYNGSRGGTDDGGDNGGGDIDERRHSQYLINQFTCENDFTHCTQDEDHGSRRAGPGIGAIGRPYRGRERMMEPYNEELLSRSFESMSIGTQFSDSSNETNAIQIPYQMEEGFGVNTWVNFEYPIHVEAVGRTQEIYAWHVRIYNQYYRGSLTWYQYCLQQQAGVPSSINPIEPHRNSFWY